MKKLLVVLLLASTTASAQTAPTSYTFTFTPEETDAVYLALERSSQIQSMVTGDRSPKMDALETKLKLGVAQQKEVAAKPKEEPKKEEPKP